jgi:hypothetical protein
MTFNGNKFISLQLCINVYYFNFKIQTFRSIHLIIELSLNFERRFFFQKAKDILNYHGNSQSVYKRNFIIQGVSELPPQRKKEVPTYLGKCDNLNFKEKKSCLKR